VGRGFRLNCIQKQELRRYDPRSKSPRKNAFSTPFQGVLPLSGLRILTESGRVHPLSGTPGNVVRPFRLRHAPRSKPPAPHAPHPHAPRRHPLRLAGSGRTQPPRWLLPATDRRNSNDRTGPDRDEQPLYFNMSPNQAIPEGKSIRFCPARRCSPIKHSLMPRGAQRQRLQAYLPVGHLAMPVRSWSSTCMSPFPSPKVRENLNSSSVSAKPPLTPRSRVTPRSHDR